MPSTSKSSKQKLDASSEIIQKAINQSLVAAVRANNCERITRLLELGADVNTRSDDDKSTCLVLAAKARFSAVVELLVKSEGVDLHAEDESGSTAFHYAIRNNDLASASALLENGIDANTVLKPRQESALVTASCRLYFPKMVKLLLQHGADPYGVDASSKICAFHRAVYWGGTSCVREFLRHDVGLLQFQFAGQFPLHLCSMYWKTSMTEMFIQLGADVNVLNSDGESVLERAARYGCFRNVKPLLDAGAIIHRPESFILQMVNEGCKADVLRYVLQKCDGIDFSKSSYPEQSPAHVAAERGKWRVMEVLLEFGFDPNQLDTTGSTAAQVALHEFPSDAIKVWKVLLRANVDLEVISDNYDGDVHYATEYTEGTLFENAMWYGDYKNASFLAEAGVDIQGGHAFIHGDALKTIAEDNRGYARKVDIATTNLVQMICNPRSLQEEARTVIRKQLGRRIADVAMTGLPPSLQDYVTLKSLLDVQGSDSDASSTDSEDESSTDNESSSNDD